MVQETICDMVKEYSCGSIFRRVSAAPSVGISRCSYTEYAADRFQWTCQGQVLGVVRIGSKIQVVVANLNA